MSGTIERAPDMRHHDGPQQARTGIAAFVRRHAVPTYYALTFIISWGAILVCRSAWAWKAPQRHMSPTYESWYADHNG
jgi:hypothetical protein